MSETRQPQFDTASLIDQKPDLPSCETPFLRFGKRSKFCGEIRTIKCFRDNGLVKKILNTPSPGSVLVVDGRGSLASALMGDMIAEAAYKNGWEGVVIFGAIRDSVAINAIDFGVKALGTNPRKSSKEGAGEVDVPVTFGNVTFTPGFMLYSDEDGIVLAPAALI